MPENTAAWILESRARFTVKEAPYTRPQSHEVVIEVGAVASNPLDYKIQDHDPIPRFPLKYPNILGCDAAGTITEIGSEVENLAVGDRVMVHTFGFISNQPQQSAFQKYVVVSGLHPVRIPEHLSFAEAAVLPLSCDTAMAGLYLEDALGLQYPAMYAKPVDKTLLVWGGSSSVGCSVIQMAVASGYEVFAVAGKRNHKLCSSLGASQVFDHADTNVVSTIVSVLKGRDLVGAYDCIADYEKSTKPCADILAQSQGSKRLMAVLDPPQAGLPEGIQASRVFIPKMIGTEVPRVVRAWMVEALKAQKLLPKPDPTAVGHGLEHIQTAVDTLRKGVSGTKVVVTL